MEDGIFCCFNLTREAGSPKVKIAVVGGGTSQTFAKFEDDELLSVSFTPSKGKSAEPTWNILLERLLMEIVMNTPIVSSANAKYLSAELPFTSGGNKKVLYPASQKASQDLRKDSAHLTL